MAKVKVDTSKLNVRPVIPNGLYTAEIINCEYPFQAPWDSENFGVNFEFQITESGPNEGRRLSCFVTTTNGKPFAGRYAEFLTNIGVDPDSEWDTDQIIGKMICIRVGQYSGKDGNIKNSVDEIFQSA